MPINYAEYPEGWIKTIRPRILDRAGHRCEVCGIEEYAVKDKHTGRVVLSGFGSYTEARDQAAGHYGLIDLPKIVYKNYFTVVVLSIAHLDHDHTNHEVSDDRLKAMCASCHFTYDAELHHRHRRQSLYAIRHRDQLSLFH